MAEKLRACKSCGHLTSQKECGVCGSKEFVTKFKGRAVIFDVKKSLVAEKLKIKKEGAYAIKYGQN